MNQNSPTLSTLPHTWILDADGTLCVHNGYLQGEDKPLPGVKEFFASLPKEDMVVGAHHLPQERLPRSVWRLFARRGHSLQSHHLRSSHGERILVNDEKPSGLRTAYAISKQRDAASEVNFIVDKEV